MVVLARQLVQRQLPFCDSLLPRSVRPAVSVLLFRKGLFPSHVRPAVCIFSVVALVQQRLLRLFGFPLLHGELVLPLLLAVPFIVVVGLQCHVGRPHQAVHQLVPEVVLLSLRLLHLAGQKVPLRLVALHRHLVGVLFQLLGGQQGVGLGVCLVVLGRIPLQRQLPQSVFIVVLAFHQQLPALLSGARGVVRAVPAA